MNLGKIWKIQTPPSVRVSLHLKCRLFWFWHWSPPPFGLFPQFGTFFAWNASLISTSWLLFCWYYGHNPLTIHFIDIISLMIIASRFSITFYLGTEAKQGYTKMFLSFYRNIINILQIVSLLSLKSLFFSHYCRQELYTHQTSLLGAPLKHLLGRDSEFLMTL